jgi:hypothetical protein
VGGKDGRWGRGRSHCLAGSHADIIDVFEYQAFLRKP